MQIILFPAVCVGLLVVGHGYGWWSRRRVRARRLARVIPIAELEDGRWATVMGIVGAVAPPMTSPGKQLTCIGFRLWVSRLGDEGGPVLDEQVCAPFSLEDDTGKVLVDGPVQLQLEPDLFHSILPRQDGHVIEETGAPPRPWSHLGGEAFWEKLLSPGDRVTVLGLASFEPDPTQPAAGFRSPALRVHLRGSKEEPVVVVAEPGRRVSR